MIRTQKWMPVVAAVVFAACGELPEEPVPNGTATLTIRVEASGEDIDDTVLISLDGGTPRFSSGGSSVRYLDVEFGRHNLQISGVSKNCVVTGGETQSFEVGSSTSTLTIRLTCAAIDDSSGGGGATAE